MGSIVLVIVILIGLFGKTIQYGIEAFKGKGGYKKVSIFVLFDIAICLLLISFCN